MITGKWGVRLAIVLAILLPLERFQQASLMAADGFVMLIILASWLLFWRKCTRLRFPLATGMWLIFTGSLIGALAMLDLFAATLALVQEVYLYVAFLTLVNAFVDREALLAFGKAWVSMAVVESVLLVMGRFGIGPAFLRVVGDRGDISDIGRSVGTFLNANAAGGYMLVSLFLLIYLPFPRNRLIRAGFFGAYALGIFAAGSNGAILGIAVGLVVMALYWLYHRGRTLLFALGAAAAMLPILLLVVSLVISFISASSDQVDKDDALFAFTLLDQKLYKRLYLWTGGVELMKQYPLGVGPDVTASVQDVGLHNDFLAFLVERGPLGFIGLIGLIGELLYWLALAARHSTTWPQRRQIGVLLGGLVGLWTTATTHEITHGRSVWLLFAIIYLHYRFLEPIRTPALEKSLAAPSAEPDWAPLR